MGGTTCRGPKLVSCNAHSYAHATAKTHCQRSYYLAIRYATPFCDILHRLAVHLSI